MEARRWRATGSSSAAPRRRSWTRRPARSNGSARGWAALGDQFLRLDVAAEDAQRRGPRVRVAAEDGGRGLRAHSLVLPDEILDELVRLLGFAPSGRSEEHTSELESL